MGEGTGGGSARRDAAAGSAPLPPPARDAVPMVPGRIGVVDTTFAQLDMGAVAVRRLRDLGSSDVIRRTVPGIKDLPVACKRLFEQEGCELVMALGMPGDQPIDMQCAHEAALGIQWAMLAASRHIIEVFVHKGEAGGSPRTLRRLLKQRTLDHCQSAYDMVFDSAAMTARAGGGVRQGFESPGAIDG